LKPLVVIGLDGASEEVLNLPDADLPNIQALRNEGSFSLLRSTVPPITAAAWASMFTGWNPGRHGMYDFRRLDIHRYTRLWGAGHSAAFSEAGDFVTSRRWAGAAFWDLVGETQRVAVLSVPMTFPPWAVNGELIAGFPLPDYGRNHSSPADVGERVAPLLERADQLRKLSDSELVEHCLTLIDRQATLVRQWLANGDHDVVVVVFQSTDFAQHRLWKYLDSLGDPHREGLLNMYRAIDRLVGDARSMLGQDATIAVVSDHGFGPHPRTFIRTDALLAQEGLLKAPTTRRRSGLGSAAGAMRRAPALRRALRLGINRLPQRASDWIAARYTGASQVDWSKTLAYRIPLYAPAEGIVVNLRGRQEEGVVEPGEEYESVRDRIIGTLVDLVDPTTGEPVVVWARRREEVYAGPYLEEAPDVVALLRPRFKGTSGLGAIFEPVPRPLLETYSGVHAMDGIFAIAGPGVRSGVTLGTRPIVDVAPTLLAVLGVPVPDDLDGVPMHEALLEPALTSTASRSRARVDDEGASGLTASERGTMEESLRALGYLE
jgi:predicted AlkP superfamily phosphohydrolase/phosphomutase